MFDRKNGITVPTPKSDNSVHLVKDGTVFDIATYISEIFPGMILIIISAHNSSFIALGLVL